MPNRIIAFLLILLIPLSANASDMIVLNGFLSIAYMLFFIPLALLIHLIVTVYFQKKGYYRGKSFTIKYLIIAMLVPITGIALLTFEYLSNMSRAGMHVGTFLSILFVYGFLSLIFAIPYLLHLTATEK